MKAGGFRKSGDIDRAAVNFVAAAGLAIAALAASTEASAMNLVANGDFSGGNSGFASTYTYEPGPSGLVPEGTYFVGTNPNYSNSNWSSIGLPAGAANTAQMMIVNGGSVGNNTVWTETINVTPNTAYNFATDIASLYSTSPATMNFTVNGSALGTTFTPGATVGTWSSFFSTWYSGSSTTVTLGLVDTNTDANGNDFALTEICLDTGSSCATGTGVGGTTPVPLPASTLLLLSGLSGIAGLAWRRRVPQRS